MNKQDKEPEQKLEYGTREHAEAMYEMKMGKRKKTFCPIANSTCHQDCVSYVELQVVNDGAKDTPFWICKGGFCSAYMLVGPTQALLFKGDEPSYEDITSRH